MATIYWSVLAKEDYWNNIDYLLSEWTQEEALNFITKVDEYLNIIAKKPKTFKNTGYKNIHVVPIVSQISLFYRIVDKNNVELVRFWNNYKNPEQLKL
jgi:plasmid stabilization system protein ParE